MRVKKPVLKNLRMKHKEILEMVEQARFNLRLWIEFSEDAMYEKGIGFDCLLAVENLLNKALR